MNAFRVVADSSCLIGLVHIDLFTSLKDMFRQVYIPSAVYDEVVVRGKGKIGADDVETAVNAGWLINTSVQDELAVKALLPTLSRGESEVIVLATELQMFSCPHCDESYFTAEKLHEIEYIKRHRHERAVKSTVEVVQFA